MSFTRNGDKVQNGDIVILYLGHNSMQYLKVVMGKEHHTRFGTFAHDDIIGKAFGSKIFCNNRQGWTYVLRPSPELWTVTLPHRTQILYSADISLIVFELELKPGSIVVESGTGSGSISHAFIRSIMPSGHLYTFDFHKERAEQASAEFKDHGLDSYVTASCQDVSSCGFGLRNKADAVFLDLPMPWRTIDFAKDTLKNSDTEEPDVAPISNVKCMCSDNAIWWKTVHLFPMYRASTKDSRKVEAIWILRCKDGGVYMPIFGHKNCSILRGKILESGEASAKYFLPFAHCPLANESPADVLHVCSANWNDSFVHLSSRKECSSSKRIYFPGHEDHTRAPFHTAQKPGCSKFLAAQVVKDIPGHTGYLTFASLLPLCK